MTNAKFNNIDYYGDAASFIEIVAVNVAIKELFLNKVNSKSFFDADFVESKGLPKSFMKATYFDSFEHTIGKDNLVHKSMFELTGGNIKEIYGD